MRPWGSPHRRLERVFVVRLWREAGAAPDGLRGSVDDVTEHDQHAFASLDDLMAYLRLRLESRVGSFLDSGLSTPETVLRRPAPTVTCEVVACEAAADSGRTALDTPKAALRSLEDPTS
jgi:hypothetical protein